jgi:hypothetical protein
MFLVVVLATAYFVAFTFLFGILTRYLLVNKKPLRKIHFLCLALYVIQVILFFWTMQVAVNLNAPKPITPEIHQAA